MPPIQVNQHNELIDGWHRWTAHRKAEAEDIEAVVIETASDAELLELAIESNASHGLQLTQADKRDMARKIYNQTPERERDEKKKRLAKILSVSERTVRDWLSRMDKDAKVARNQRIFDMWLGCSTQQEIADAVGMPRKTINNMTTGYGENGSITKLATTQQVAAEHGTGCLCSRTTLD